MAPDVVVVVSVVVVGGVISLGQKWPRNLMTNCHIDAFRILLRNECCHACRIATQANTDALKQNWEAEPHSLIIIRTEYQRGRLA